MNGSTNLRRLGESAEDLGGHSVWVLHDGKEQMLDPDVAVAQVLRDLTDAATILS